MPRTAAVLLFVAAATGLPAQPPPDRTFTDAVEVTESSVVIELPRLRNARPSDFESGDFVVEVAGERRGVTGVSALEPKTNPRPVLVYVDAVLAKPETVRLGTEALARHARQLVALGPVEIVLHDGAVGGSEQRLTATTARGDAGIRAAGDLEAGLAAHGWIVIAMALHVPTPDPDYGAPRPIGYEQWKALTPGVKMAPSAGEVSRLQGLSASSFDLYVEPRYEPLRRAASASCGAALRVEHQLAAEFGRLERRLLLRFTSEAAGPDQGALAAMRFLPVEVRLAEVSRFADRRKFKRWLGLVPREERLHFGRWVQARRFAASR